MSIPQEYVDYPPDVEEHVRPSPTSSGTKENYQPNIYDGADLTEFPFPQRNHGDSRSHLLKRERIDKENRPRRSSSHSRHSSRSLATHLFLTNERLTVANERNITLESQKEELLVRFTALVKDKTSVEAELRSTQESLRLHQVQLELAQSEVNRATDVVRKVDQARVQAENEAARLRSRVRQLEAEKVTRQGWEEGWEIGFQEGIERAEAESGLVNRFFHRRRRSSTKQRSESRGGETDNGEVEADDSTISSPVRTVRSSSISTRKRKPFIPDDELYVAPAVPTSISDVQPTLQSPLTSRTRERARSFTSRMKPRSPSSEPHPTVSQQRKSRSSHFQAHTFPTEQYQTSSPEVIRPLPVPRPTSSLSHRSVVPPDNYIPTMTPTDNFIPMPPPHELSVPVSSATPIPSEPEIVQAEHANRRVARTVPRSRAASTGSRASTRISEYDLVSPPRERAKGMQVSNPDFKIRTNGESGSSSKQMVEEWRNIMTTTTPLRREPSGETRLEAESLQTHSRVHSATTAVRPRSPRVSGGPRTIRNIAQPMPLSAETLSRMDPRDSSSIQHGAVPIDRGPQPVKSPPQYSRIEQLQQQADMQAGPSGTSTSESSPPAGSARTKTPIAWLKKHFQRSYSSPVIPNIQIEPPSQTPTSSSSNDGSRLNPVLLSPEDASRPIALPNDVIAEATRGVAILPTSTPVPNAPITIQLPDGELPLGFVPTSPMMTYAPQRKSGHNYDDSVSFSPIPDNYSLPDPFHSNTESLVQRPYIATASDRLEKEGTRMPSRMSFGGHWGSVSSDSARLSRPLSLFSDD